MFIKNINVIVLAKRNFYDYAFNKCQKPGYYRVEICFLFISNKIYGH